MNILMRLSRFLQEEHYEFGDMIVKQGDPANSFYVLTKGRARALKIKPDGEEIPLGVLKPGDSFRGSCVSRGWNPKCNRALQHSGGCFAD